MFIFFWTKNTWILLFLVEDCEIKTDIIRYYLLPKSTELKIWNQNVNVSLSLFNRVEIITLVCSS